MMTKFRETLTVQNLYFQVKKIAITLIGTYIIYIFANMLFIDSEALFYTKLFFASSYIFADGIIFKLRYVIKSRKIFESYVETEKYLLKEGFDEIRVSFDADNFIAEIEVKNATNAEKKQLIDQLIDRLSLNDELKYYMKIKISDLK